MIALIVFLIIAAVISFAVIVCGWGFCVCFGRYNILSHLINPANHSLALGVHLHWIDWSIFYPTSPPPQQSDPVGPCTVHLYLLTNNFHSMHIAALIYRLQLHTEISGLVHWHYWLYTKIWASQSHVCACLRWYCTVYHQEYIMLTWLSLEYF